MEVWYYIIKNLLVLLGSHLIVLCFHEMGHYIVAKMVDPKPKLIINPIGTSKVKAVFPKERYHLLMGYSAINGIIYGYLIIYAITLVLLVLYGNYYLPALITLQAAYLIGIMKDLKTVQKMKQ